MSEDIAALPESQPDTAGLAMDLAMEEARADGFHRAKVDAFFSEQISLIAIQKHHLIQQFSLAQWEKRLGVFLRLATAVVGIAVATALGLTVWDAAHSRGLIIEPFSVPPDLAGRGLTGEVVASQVLDKLTAMSKTESSRAVQSYANNWGNDIKMEIPETGVSVGELRRFLRNWLGHDIRISGEVYRTPTGIAVTARTAGDSGARFIGAETDLDALVQQAAEHVYEVTQPYRYANYLDRNYDPKGLQQRIAKATAIYKKLIAGDNRVERAWAWNGLGTIEFRFHGDNRQAAWYYRKALAENPDLTIGYYALASRTTLLGQEEGYYQQLKQASQRLHNADISDVNPHYAVYVRTSADALIAAAQGDLAAAIALSKAGAQLPDDFSVLARGVFTGNGLVQMARQHDLKAMRTWSRQLGMRELPNFNVRLWYDYERQDWRDMLKVEQLRRKELAATADAVTRRLRQNGFNQLRPLFAIAHAQLGDFSGAQALVAPLPADNTPGVRVRAAIADLKGDYARADWWFAHAEAQTPSLPLNDLVWGQALLRRGQPDAAIAKFQRANTLGPKFADPLEGWGEALVAKNQSHLALAKFAEAEKYAPNWGRLHLKWGQALAYAGKPDEAKAHLTRATTLDLTPSEKSELARSYAVATNP